MMAVTFIHVCLPSARDIHIPPSGCPVFGTHEDSSYALVLTRNQFDVLALNHLQMTWKDIYKLRICE
ncbi:hypothetical protein VAWG006_17720 [Aeromonas enteropelogenes]|nr:hypothetical protein VAWG006_17720 [Aeromonas enteropelogenes]BEE21683.1 hypothetical protein VAWG007_17780 [Aeromonas enteropelogenes]